MKRFTVPNNGRHSRKSDGMRIRRDQAHSQELQAVRQATTTEQVLVQTKK